MSSQTSNRRLPATASGYELRQQIGKGTCAHVYRAWCQEIEDEVAIKVVELEWLQASLEDIGREIQVMSLSSHPNVVPFSTAFVQDADLWIVMPLLTGGSVLSLMNCAFRDGLPEDYAVYVLWCVLKALEYFHGNGQMHRDVKAANLMLDSNGNTMLSDYGMMGWMVEGGWDRKQRQTFVGTPCWMAPEVMEQASGYDYKADVWSLGITAIELAQGRAPYYNYPPMKVLFLTLQNPPPTITGTTAETLSAKYHDFVAACLQKDPKLRPTVKQLLKHPLFSGGVTMPDSLADTIAKLPPIGSRGGSQKQLFRQLQKNAAPQRSGIHDRSSRGLGWDFGEDDSKQQSESGSSQGKASTQASHISNLDISPTSTIPSTRSKEDITDAQGLDDDQVSRSSHLAGAAPDMSASQFVPTAASTINGASLLSGIPSNPMPSDASFGRGSGPGDLVDPSHPAQRTAVPAKTVGLLRKGRFTVSDVTNPDKLDGKIDSFLDDSSDLETCSKEDNVPPPVIPPSLIPQNIKESKPNAASAMQSSQAQTQQPASSPPHVAAQSIPPASSQPSYAQVVSANPAERSFASGIAPVVINVDLKPERSDPVALDAPRQAPSVPVPPIPIHTVQQSKPMQRAVTVVGPPPQSRPIQNIPPTGASAPTNHVPPPVKQATQIMGGEVSGQAALGTPLRSPPSGNQVQQTMPVVIQSVSTPTHTAASSVASGSSQSAAASMQPANSAAAPLKRKSRFEVKDVQTVSSKPVGSGGGSSGSGSSIPVLKTSNTPIPQVGNPALPPSGIGAPSVTKAKSRFEVKDVDQRQRALPLPNGSPPIVNISSSSLATLNSSRQSTPLVSPLPEPVPMAPQGQGRQAFSLLAELQHTIQTLVQENETLKRENSFLRSKTQVSGPGNTIGPTRSPSPSEISTKGSSPQGSSTALPHHVPSANAVVSHGIAVAQPQPGQHGRAQGHAQAQAQGHAQAQAQGHAQVQAQGHAQAQAQGHVQAQAQGRGVAQAGQQAKVVQVPQAHAQISPHALTGRPQVLVVSSTSSGGVSAGHSQQLPPVTSHETLGVKHSNSYPQYEHDTHVQTGQRTQQGSPSKPGDTMLQHEQDRVHAAVHVSRMEQSMGNKGMAYNNGLGSQTNTPAAHANVVLAHGSHIGSGGVGQMGPISSTIRTDRAPGVHVVNSTSTSQAVGNIGYGGAQQGMQGGNGNVQRIASAAPGGTNVQNASSTTSGTLSRIVSVPGEPVVGVQRSAEHDQNLSRKDATLPG